MVDLIPIGTTNRTPTENNAVKPSREVKQVERPNRVANQKSTGEVGQYRSRNRRRNRLDRRERRLESGPIINRRARHERRFSALAQVKPEAGQADERRGWYIDEEV